MYMKLKLTLSPNQVKALAETYGWTKTIETEDGEVDNPVTKQEAAQNVVITFIENIEDAYEAKEEEVEKKQRLEARRKRRTKVQIDA